MKLLKCDVCGYTQTLESKNGEININDENKNYFYELYHDKQKYDLCNTCMNEYRQLKHDLTAAFIFYPDRKKEIKISKEQYCGAQMVGGSEDGKK